MRTIVFTVLICSSLLAVPTASVSAIYKYRNAEGTLTFVDDESKVPAQFRDQVKSLPDAQESLVTYDPQPELKLSAPSPATREGTDEVPVEEPPEKQRTQVQIKGNRVLVPVEVAMGNRVAKLVLLLDTGATTTVIHRQSLAGLNLPSGKMYKARVAGGGVVKSEKIRFRHINIGPFHQEKAYAMVISITGDGLPFDGMLGMDFLKKHPYRIDFQNQFISWESLD
jgi:predicted aspartyl protease